MTGSVTRVDINISLPGDFNAAAMQAQKVNKVKSSVITDLKRNVKSVTNNCISLSSGAKSKIIADIETLSGIVSTRKYNFFKTLFKCAFKDILFTSKGDQLIKIKSQVDRIKLNERSQSAISAKEFILKNKDNGKLKINEKIEQLQSNLNEIFDNFSNDDIKVYVKEMTSPNCRHITKPSYEVFPCTRGVIKVEGKGYETHYFKHPEEENFNEYKKILKERDDCKVDLLKFDKDVTKIRTLIGGIDPFEDVAKTERILNDMMN
ncbi:hypothetical protein ACVBEF_07350 [Glaciimonas sp. GG7]